ncbi:MULTISPECIES: acyl carrier protein [Limosilactobacillus]|uniref:Acyl carrier protein n=1 Tax=Limosilactobacillus reuteri TaxID=1598 RepID=A0AAX2SSQ4_LIMRT|nr:MULTISPECIES: phosphopantetheine-binding protein [Limosilactobacillus]MBB1110745.1 acyl carrier protein [Limosilactobacillus balticus]RMX26257.1 acyl carrier protein [Limosilactobacillus reuteri]TGB10647.1 acyl carrier protein [Limosilactobacillus reuteri]
MKYSVEEIKDILKKKVLIERLELDDVKPEDITDTENLFDEEGLALDSVEALDIMTGISEEFNIDTSTLGQEDINHFQSIDDMAKYILEKE